MNWRRLWTRPSVPDSEAATQLARLEDHDPQVEQLGRELRAYRRRDDFSGMVDQAIHRAVQRGA